MQEQDRDRLRALRHCVGHGRVQLALVELDQHLALGVQALADLVAQVTLDQRLVAAEEQIVGFRPVDAADLVDVSEPLRGDERAGGAGALENGVDCNRGAVKEKPGRAKLTPALPTPLSMPVTSRAGVVSVFPSWSCPVVASNAATSVKVPPTSAESRIRPDSGALNQRLRWSPGDDDINGHREPQRRLRRGGPALLRAACRHHLAREQFDGSQDLLARQIAERELADHVVASGLRELGGQEIRDRRGRAGDALAALDHQVEGGGTGMRLRASMPAEQIGEARVPAQIGGAGERQRLRIARRHDDEATEPELGVGRGRGVDLRPDRAVALDGEPGLGGGSRLTTLRLRRAARSALSTACRPYQIGGCGFCSGSISIGTLSKAKCLLLKSSVLCVNPASTSSTASA